MGLPRDDVVFRLWQCDKENHGWRKVPPLTVPPNVSIRWRAFTLPAKSARRKKEYSVATPGAPPPEHWPV